MENWAKYIAAAAIAGAIMGAAYFYPAETFIAFVTGWLFIIPAAFIVYLVYALWVYSKDLRHTIIVKIKPSEAMKSLQRIKAAQRKMQKLLYEETNKDKKSYGFIA
jgi:hypothetical protein